MRRESVLPRAWAPWLQAPTSLPQQGGTTHRLTPQLLGAFSMVPRPCPPESTQTDTPLFLLLLLREWLWPGSGKAYSFALYSSTEVSPSKGDWERAWFLIPSSRKAWYQQTPSGGDGWENKVLHHRACHPDQGAQGRHGCHAFCSGLGSTDGLHLRPGGHAWNLSAICSVYLFDSRP